MTEPETQPRDKDELLIKRLVVRDPEAVPRITAVRPVEHYRRNMDAVGVSLLLEMYAGGNLPVEIAAMYDWPFMVFQTWLEDAATPDELATAKKLCAQSMQARSMAVLTMDRRDAADATLMTSLSRQAAAAASKLDPTQWGGNDQLGLGGGGGVVFNINLGSETPFAGKVVEALREGEQVETNDDGPFKVTYDTLGGFPPAPTQRLVGDGV